MGPPPFWVPGEGSVDAHGHSHRRAHADGRLYVEFVRIPVSYTHLDVYKRQVKSRGGRFILRIEDLDTARCRPEYAYQLMDDLCWLGLVWDEGPGADEPSAPYFQSRCTPAYEAALEVLCRTQQVYPCFCSRADLHAASAPHLADGTALYLSLIHI